MVTAVKRDRKVGLTYMKSFEIEQRIREEGLARGKAVGLAEAVLDLLGSLGDVPAPLRERISAQNDEPVLRAWLKLAAKAESMEEFEKQITKE